MIRGMAGKKKDATGGDKSFFSEHNWLRFELLELDLERLESHVDKEGKVILFEIYNNCTPAIDQFFRMYRKYGELICFEDPEQSVFFPEYGPAVRIVGKKLKITKKMQEELMKRYNVWKSLPMDDKPELIGKKKGGQ